MSDQVSYFKFLFDKAKNLQGVVKGMDAVSFFQKSGLPTLTLRDIWNLSSFRKQGFLMQDQFELALKYITLAQRGFQVNKINLQLHQDQETLPKFQGIELPKPSKPPAPSLLPDPFAELISPMQTFNTVQNKPSQNLMGSSSLFQPSNFNPIGMSTQVTTQQNTQSSLTQSQASLQNNLLDLDGQLTKSLGKQFPSGFSEFKPTIPNPEHDQKFGFQRKEQENPTSKQNQEEDDFDDFEEAEEEETQQADIKETPQKQSNLLDMSPTLKTNESEIIKPQQDKFESFLSQNLLNFTSSQPIQAELKTEEPQTIQATEIQQKQGPEQPPVSTKLNSQEAKKDSGPSRLSLLDAAFAELDLNLKPAEEEQQERKGEEAKEQIHNEGDDFDEFQEPEEQETKVEGTLKEKKNLILMPIDLDYSVDSPSSFAQPPSEKIESEVSASKNGESSQNLPFESSPTQLRIQLQELGISLSDSESEQAKNEAKKHVVLSKPILLTDNSQIGPSSVSQDSDRTDKDQSGGGWSAFEGPMSEKKESSSTQIKSWFSSMKKQPPESEPESVQSQLNKVFPALEGINTFPELEKKQQAQNQEQTEKEGQSNDDKHEEDFGDFEDAKSEEDKTEDKSPKIFELEQQVTVNRPNDGLQELSFLQKIEFDQKQLLSNFQEEFKEDMPRRSTVKTVKTTEKEESIADEGFPQDVIFSARPSITQRYSENCFENFKPTELPKQISKLALSNEEEMKTLAKFLFEKHLFKYQRQIQLESQYQKEIVQLNVEKRKAMEADELELAIEYRQKIKSKQAQMHGQQYLEEIEQKLISMSSEQDEEYWIWNEFRDLMEECLKLKRVSKDDYSEKYIESLSAYEAQLRTVVNETDVQGYEALLLEMKNKTNILKNVKRVTLEVIAQKCSLVCEGLNEECVKLKERIAGLVQILAQIENQALQEETLDQFLHSSQFSTFYQGVASLRRIRANLFSSLSEINAYIESSVSIEIEGTLQQLGNLERDFQEINMLLDQLVQDSETSLRNENGHSSSDKFNFIDSLSQPLTQSDSNAQYEFKSFLKTLIEI